MDEIDAAGLCLYSSMTLFPGDGSPHRQAGSSGVRDNPATTDCVLDDPGTGLCFETL